MKHTYVDIEENVNISEINPIKEFFFLGGKILIIFIILYFALVFFIDTILLNLSVKQEEALAGRIWNIQQEKPFIKVENKAQKIVNKLTESLTNNQRHFRVHVVSNKDVNAGALPGGHILVYTGLLKSVKSENELAFVLAHEMGHIINKDSIKSLSKNIAIASVSTFLFSADKKLNTLFNGSIEGLNLKFSRDAEEKADKFGLHLLNDSYGHAGGAIEFFKNIEVNYNKPKFVYYFSTHPSPQSRIKNINSEIKLQNFNVNYIDNGFNIFK